MSWLKAFLHDDLMKEHFLGFSLKKTRFLVGEERMQALTVKVEEWCLLFN